MTFKSQLNEKLSRVREKFEQELITNGHLYHSIDIERVRNEQWQVERFLIDQQPNDDENEAFKALCKSLQWKKSFGIHERCDQSFAKELWELCSVEINGRDYKGRVIQWESIRNQRKFKELKLIAQQFVAHNIERLDRMAGSDGFILVSNIDGANFSNIDNEIIQYKLATIDHYPVGLRQLLVVDLPWFFNSLVRVMLSFTSPRLQEMIIYCKRTELTKYIDEKYIHHSLNGKRYERSFPENLRPLDQMMSELNLDEQFINYFYQTFKLKRTNL